MKVVISVFRYVLVIERTRNAGANMSLRLRLLSLSSKQLKLSTMAKKTPTSMAVARKLKAARSEGQRQRMLRKVCSYTAFNSVLAEHGLTRSAALSASAGDLPDTSSPDPSLKTTLPDLSRVLGELTPNTRPSSPEPQDAPQTLKDMFKGQSEQQLSPIEEGLDNKSDPKLAATRAELERKHSEELISIKEELENQHAKQLAAQKEQLQEEHKKEMATVHERHTAVLETYSAEITRLNGRYDRIHGKCRGYLELYKPILQRADKAEDLLHETEETLAECMKQAGIVQEEDKSDEITWYGSPAARFRGCYEVARDQVKRLKHEKNE